MSLSGDMLNQQEKSEAIWRALADNTRRCILDLLAERPLTTGQIVRRFEDSHCRTAVMKHMDILVKANLIVVRREGRTRWNYLNPVPIQRVCDRWVSKHVKHMASSLSRLKDMVEERDSMEKEPANRRMSGQGFCGRFESAHGDSEKGKSDG
jgi:DNA-binding transcriptional ArsR family regulator